MSCLNKYGRVQQVTQRTLNKVCIQSWATHTRTQLCILCNKWFITTMSRASHLVRGSVFPSCRRQREQNKRTYREPATPSSSTPPPSPAVQLPWLHLSSSALHPHERRLHGDKVLYSRRKVSVCVLPLPRSVRLYGCIVSVNPGDTFFFVLALLRHFSRRSDETSSDQEKRKWRRLRAILACMDTVGMAYYGTNTCLLSGATL